LKHFNFRVGGSASSGALTITAEIQDAMALKHGAIKGNKHQ